MIVPFFLQWSMGDRSDKVFRPRSPSSRLSDHVRFLLGFVLRWPPEGAISLRRRPQYRFFPSGKYPSPGSIKTKRSRPIAGTGSMFLRCHPAWRLCAHFFVCCHIPAFVDGAPLRLPYSAFAFPVALRRPFRSTVFRRNPTACGSLCKNDSDVLTLHLRFMQA